MDGLGLEGCRKVVSELDHLLLAESVLVTGSKKKAVVSALGWIM